MGGGGIVLRFGGGGVLIGFLNKGLLVLVLLGVSYDVGGYFVGRGVFFGKRTLVFFGEFLEF